MTNLLVACPSTPPQPLEHTPKSVQSATMNWGALTAFTMQVACIAIGAVGVYELVKGQQSTGWALIGVSGISAAVDVAKVSNQLKQTAEQATAAASTTTTVSVQKPAPVVTREVP